MGRKKTDQKMVSVALINYYLKNQTNKREVGGGGGGGGGRRGREKGNKCSPLEVKLETELYWSALESCMS